METYNAKLISADFEESTMEFEIQHEFTVKAGDYVILHKADYEKLVSGVESENGKLPPHIIKSVCDHKKMRGPDGLYYCGKCGIPMSSKD